MGIGDAVGIQKSPVFHQSFRNNWRIMGVYEKNIIPIKISHLAAYVARVKRISLDDALVYIYAKQIGISVVSQVPMRLGCICYRLP